jgi:hypothetical protein
MKSKKLAGSKPKNSTQKFLDIAEIRNDTVILKDGTLRAVVLVSSINFALKSEEEQNAIISSYVTFMNSFDYPLQIVVQSRKLNIDGYLMDLQKKEKAQMNDQLRMLMTDYRQFVNELVDLGDIMSKTFYVVIPYSPISDKKKSFWTRLYEVFNPSSLINLKEKNYQKYRRTLMQRVEQTMMGLNSMGLQSAVLDTQSLIELYYKAYNPVVSENQELQDVQKIRIDS